MIALLALTALPSAGHAAGQELDAFSYPDTASARAHWVSQFGSLPVRVQTLDDGTTCLALDAEFKGQNDRACWDWEAPLHLSGVRHIAFDLSALEGSLVATIGIYFGTANGWYARFFGGRLPEAWTERTFRLDAFGMEDQPDGWDRVERFRFSVWSAGAGKATFRLRNLRTVPQDPGENFLKNGSFEIPGVGVPYAWGSGHWGVGDLPWAVDMDLWRRRFRLDTSAAKHGLTSLCIDNTPDLPLLKAYSVWVTPPGAVERCVLSAWLQSDQESLPVTLDCGGRSTRVEVGRDWTQAALPDIPCGERVTAIIAPQAPGKLRIDAVQLQGLDQPTAEFHPAFVDEAIAERERLVDWSPPRRTPDVAAGRVVTGPVEPATAKIDTHARFLLDGEPYIQHSLGLEFVSDLDILDFVAESGFRDVCVQVKPGVTTDGLTEIFDRCARVGLRIIPWLDGRMSREQFIQHIQTLKGHPALLCWYVYDEPSGDRFAEADARYRMARDLDPAHPALINYLSSKLEGHTGDIYSTDVYPIPHSSPSAAINAVRTMRAAAEEDNKPVWMWLQGTGYAYWMDREPSPRELSCMVYGSLIEGARGIYYFAQIPRTKECFGEMRALCVEVEALTPALSSLDTAPVLSCDQPNILAKAFALDGRVWVLAVNTQSSPAEARFVLPQAAGEVEVVFEGRALRASGGSWSDGFGPYERHVYRLRPPGQ